MKAAGIITVTIAALRKADEQREKLRNSPIRKGLDQVMELSLKSIFLLPIQHASLTIRKGVSLPPAR
ncbi:MAG: hypothetical protein M3O09_04585 [Acidobacteriota bacterium]|nr:hypothetical protein [Acidobacteriota bacterium]